MERIVIEVDSATAQAWREMSAELKHYMEEIFRIKMDVISRKNREVAFKKLLNEAREEAAKNGLTEEILQQLLNES